MAENPNPLGRATPPKTPGWVKVFFIIILFLVLIVIFAHLMGLRFDHGAGVFVLAGVIGVLNPPQDMLA